MTNWGAKVTVFFTFFVWILSWGFCLKITLDNFDLTGLLSLSTKSCFSWTRSFEFAGEGADSARAAHFWSLMILILLATFMFVFESLRGLVGSSSNFAISITLALLNFGVKNFLTSELDSNRTWEFCRENDALVDVYRSVNVTSSAFICSRESILQNLSPLWETLHFFPRKKLNNDCTFDSFPWTILGNCCFPDRGGRPTLSTLHF